jgi:hypothetical protein
MVAQVLKRKFSQVNFEFFHFCLFHKHFEIGLLLRSILDQLENIIQTLRGAKVFFIMQKGLLWHFLTILRCELSKSDWMCVVSLFC